MATATLFFTTFSVLFPSILTLSLVSAVDHAHTCRSYCGNVTVDYPFTLRSGCGHPGFRDLLFCINNVLMLHISSGSYRVLNIDYAYESITLHDPDMSTCHEIVLGGRGNGFEIEPWRAPHLNPAPDNVFMLIGCSAESPLFQGFPAKHLACRNVSGMGCEDYYGCPAWKTVGRRKPSTDDGSGPPECCALPFGVIRAINLSRLQCEGYSSAYSVAPLRTARAQEWSYGIRVKYSLSESGAFCRACEATGGACGYGSGSDGKDEAKELCMCGRWNSSTNCDSVNLTSNGVAASLASGTLKGMLICMIMWVTAHFQS